MNPILSQDALYPVEVDGDLTHHIVSSSPNALVCGAFSRAVLDEKYPHYRRVCTMTEIGSTFSERVPIHPHNGTHFLFTDLLDYKPVKFVLPQVEVKSNALMLLCKELVMATTPWTYGFKMPQHIEIREAVDISRDLVFWNGVVSVTNAFDAAHEDAQVDGHSMSQHVLVIANDNRGDPVNVVLRSYV
jgi:hypothetical protein